LGVKIKQKIKGNYHVLINRVPCSKELKITREKGGNIRARNEVVKKYLFFWVSIASRASFFSSSSCALANLSSSSASYFGRSSRRTPSLRWHHQRRNGKEREKAVTAH